MLYTSQTRKERSHYTYPTTDQVALSLRLDDEPTSLMRSRPLVFPPLLPHALNWFLLTGSMQPVRSPLSPSPTTPQPW